MGEFGDEFDGLIDVSLGNVQMRDGPDPIGIQCQHFDASSREPICDSGGAAPGGVRSKEDDIRTQAFERRVDVDTLNAREPVGQSHGVGVVLGEAVNVMF